jgi:hypothetical protein
MTGLHSLRGLGVSYAPATNEDHCPECGGAGTQLWGSREIDCDECGGSGFVEIEEVEFGFEREAHTGLIYQSEDLAPREVVAPVKRAA